MPRFEYIPSVPTYSDDNRRKKYKELAMTTNKDIEMIRQSFRPEEIRILFVEESPPVGGTFFYCGNSQMFNNMNRVKWYRGHLFESTNNFLINFKENGC